LADAVGQRWILGDLALAVDLVTGLLRSSADGWAPRPVRLRDLG